MFIQLGEETLLSLNICFIATQKKMNGLKLNESSVRVKVKMCEKDYVFINFYGIEFVGLIVLPSY